jgi:septum formation protein
MKQTEIVLLASRSPRRAELLGQVGIRFRLAVANVDERTGSGEAPQDYVLRLAGEKAAAGLAQSPTALPTLGADTVVVLDNSILGKPRDLEEAAGMLQRLSGQEHLVLSAVALALPGGPPKLALNTTRVRFAPLPGEFIDWYCRAEQILDKAGAYAIQGAMGQFVAHLDGSYSGVMGLPLYETCALLRASGVLR